MLHAALEARIDEHLRARPPPRVCNVYNGDCAVAFARSAHQSTRAPTSYFAALEASSHASDELTAARAIELTICMDIIAALLESLAQGRVEL
jgi:hypothetical protein